MSTPSPKHATWLFRRQHQQMWSLCASSSKKTRSLCASDPKGRDRYQGCQWPQGTRSLRANSPKEHNNYNMLPTTIKEATIIVSVDRRRWYLQGKKEDVHLCRMKVTSSTLNIFGNDDNIKMQMTFYYFLFIIIFYL